MISNALELLYAFAEKFNADVVSMDRFFYFTSNAEKMFPNFNDLTLQTWQGDVVDIPTIETENLEERLKKFCEDKFGRPAWKRLIQRDLLIENDITFPNSKASADMVFTLKLIYYSKRFLKIPHPLYIYRRNMESITHSEKNYNSSINFWNDVNISCLKSINEFFNEKQFFLENPIYRWNIIDYFNRVHFGHFASAVANLSPYETYEVLQNTFKETMGENSNLVAYFCQLSNLLRLNCFQMSNRIHQLESQLAKIQSDQ